MKKTVKSKNNKTDKEMNIEERRFGVILEDIDDKLNLVVEGHQALDKKIDDNHKEFQESQAEVNYKLKILVEGHQALVEGYQALDRKIDNNHKEFREFRGEVNYKFGVVFDELHLIRNELKEKVSRDEFIVLEKRVAALEKSRR